MPFFDKEIARIRKTLEDDPATARERVDVLLERTKSTTGRARLWALRITVCRRLDELADGLRAYEEGRRLGGSALAASELEWRVAELHIVRGDLGAARAAADDAVALARPLAMATPAGRGAQAHLPHANYAAALITRAQVRMFLERDPKGALPDAMEALQWADPRYATRVHLSAVSALAILVTQSGVGSAADLMAALRLADRAQRLLRRRRVPARHPHRIKLRVIRALALARLGAGELAEQILDRAIDDLRDQGLEHDAEITAEQLLWVVADRGGQAGRARLLRHKHGLAPVAPEPPAEPERGGPIGF